MPKKYKTKKIKKQKLLKIDTIFDNPSHLESMIGNSKFI